MEAVKYKKRWYYSLFVIALLILMFAGQCYIIHDITDMHVEAAVNYRYATKKVSELSDQLNQKDAEIADLQEQLENQSK